MLSIQSRPVFTISIGDMHVDEKDDLTWTCEAFGIPDVKYAWMKNSVAISGNFIDKKNIWNFLIIYSLFFFRTRYGCGGQR